MSGNAGPATGDRVWYAARDFATGQGVLNWSYQYSADADAGATCQRRVASSLPDMVWRPSAVIATALTSARWPVSRCGAAVVAAGFQTWTVPSASPATARRPSGVTASEVNRPGAGPLALAFAGVEVPQAYGPVSRAGERVAAVGCDRHTADPVRVAGQGVQAAAGRQVPVAYGPVGAAGECPAAVAGQGDAEDRLVGGDVDDAAAVAAGESHQRSVWSHPGGHPAAAVRGDGNGGDEAAVAGEGVDAGAVLEVPPAHCAVPAGDECVAGAGGDGRHGASDGVGRQAAEAVTFARKPSRLRRARAICSSTVRDSSSRRASGAAFLPRM